MRTPTIVSIQYLRGIAALMVLVFHVCEHEHLDFHIGQAGVDIFFIISGFVMWLTTDGRKVTSKEFIRRRLLRLAPLYWMVTLITAACAYVKPQFFFGVTLGWQELVQSICFIPYDNATGHAWPIVLQGWTLNIEMFFYLIFALVVSQRSRARFLIPTIILISLTASGALMPPSSALGILWSSPLLLELMVGLWLGYAFTRWRFHHRGIGLLLIAMGISAFFFYQWLDVPVNDWRFVIFGIPALALVAGCLMVERDGNVPRLPALLWLGDASYSIYLWHGLAIVIIASALQTLGIKAGATYLLALGALLASLLGYVWLERWVSRFLNSSTKT